MSEDKVYWTLHDACWLILGGVCAISGPLFGQALNKIAEMTGRVNDDQFRRDVLRVIAEFPCPLD